MKIGKISESILQRSVLKQIKNKRDEVICGAGLGVDCAIFSFAQGEKMLSSIEEAAVAGTADLGMLIHRAANNVACAGGDPVAAMISILLPVRASEAKLKRWMEEAELTCQGLGIQIAGGHTTVSEDISKAHASVTIIGKASEPFYQKVRPGQDIVISKWIGLEGTSKLARRHQEELAGKYPMYLVEEAEGFDRYGSILPEAATAIKSGASALHDISEGGVFGALWELAKGAGVGLTIELKKLPIRQETVEVCEFFSLNPYYLASTGSLIMVTDQGPALVQALEAEHIPAVLVGRTTQSNDRVILNGEEVRYLDKPQPDEIFNF